jgi:hypothetical protein
MCIFEINVLFILFVCASLIFSHHYLCVVPDVILTIVLFMIFHFLHWTSFCAVCLSVADHGCRVVAGGAAAIEIKSPHEFLRQPQDGCTALWFAAANGHIDCLRLLIDSGANINAEDMVRESVRIFLYRSE